MDGSTFTSEFPTSSMDGSGFGFHQSTKSMNCHDEKRNSDSSLTMWISLSRVFLLVFMLWRVLQYIYIHIYIYFVVFVGFGFVFVRFRIVGKTISIRRICCSMREWVPFDVWRRETAIWIAGLVNFFFLFSWSHDNAYYTHKISWFFFLSFLVAWTSSRMSTLQ